MRVLFVGNSHTYFHDMPYTFARMCEQLTGNRPEVTMLAYSNKDLQWHREEYFSLRFALLYGNYDYCVLQQQAHPFPEEEMTIRSLQRICELCKKTNTTPVLYMTWAMREEPENLMIMSRFYHNLSIQWNMKMVPVGDLFGMVQKSNPEIDLFWSDGAHASSYGDYLIAAAFAAFLSGAVSLAALDDDAVDFHLDFEGENGMPLADEEKEKATFRLDPVKAKVLRSTVEMIARIVYYEGLLDQLLSALQSENTSSQEFLKMRPVAEQLNSYYFGPLWRKDYEADEAGIIPAQIKRGVLSEDAVYNALSSYDDAIKSGL